MYTRKKKNMVRNKREVLESSKVLCMCVCLLDNYYQIWATYKFKSK